MASVQSNVSRVIIIAAIVIVLYVFWAYGRPASNRESVHYSSLECVQSICVDNKTTGSACMVGDARISEILIESDAINSHIRNIRVIPSDDRCQ